MKNFFIVQNNQIIIILILIGLNSCTQTNSTGHLKVFRYNESKGISTLDPAFARNQTTIWPVNQLFNGLVQLDDHLHVKPCIAKSWNISADGKVYSFHLRNDVYFHKSPVFPGNKGRKVVASDFLYSLSRIIDPHVASPGAWIFNDLDKEDNSAGKAFEVPDDSTFVIHLKHTFPAFISLLSMQYCSVVPHEAVDYYGKEFRSHPVGTGPFVFKAWKEGEKLVFLKNPDYFEMDGQGNRLPYIDAVNISFVVDKQSEFLEFIKGNIDFISGLTRSYKDELITRAGRLNPAYNDRIYMISQLYLNTEYLGFLVDEKNPLVKNSPLHLKVIRQAINYGFDRVKMMTYLRNNIGIPACSGFVPAGMPSFSADEVKGYEYDPVKAAELLAKAGYPEGKGLPEISLTTTNDYLDLCEYIQRQLEQSGIRIKLEISTGASFLDMVAGSKLLFFRGSWVADYPDAENYLSLFYSRNFSPAGPNYFHYSNPEFDRLYESAMNMTSDSTRWQLYHKMDGIIMEDAVVVPLYYDKVVRFVRKNISGLGSNPMNLLTLKKVEIN
ncbi:MAG: ABC transporter substrate-binding protein [Bacteroidia bacterium]|nr:ABC transporter substrate-binding protein [Bacteroidia bacterium]